MPTQKSAKKKSGGRSARKRPPKAKPSRRKSVGKAKKTTAKGGKRSRPSRGILGRLAKTVGDALHGAAKGAAKGAVEGAAAAVAPRTEHGNASEAGASEQAKK